MIIFDANVWIAIFNVDDSLHNKAKLIPETITQTVLLPEYIVVETCNVLMQRADKTVADSFIKSLENNKDVEILYAGRETFISTCATFKQIQHKKLFFVDTFLLYLSNTHEVITFDKALNKAINKQNPRR